MIPLKDAGLRVLIRKGQGCFGETMFYWEILSNKKYDCNLYFPCISFNDCQTRKEAITDFQEFYRLNKPLFRLLRIKVPKYMRV